MRAYEYSHIVGFEETNLFGNVYYANLVLWQGRCRELFLHEHAPDILTELERGLSLVTVRVSCDYFDELFAFDQIRVRMYATAVSQNRLDMRFDYFRIAADATETLVARGEQQIACMLREDDRLFATPIPGSLRQALAAFRST